MASSSPTTIGAAVELTDIDELTSTQAACIDAAVGGRDVLAVISTGGGKSAIYQLAGASRPGPTLVVVPLLALADDQMVGIHATDLPTAEAIDGRTSEGDRRSIVERVRAGQIEYLFTTPEMLQNRQLIEQLRHAGISLFVVDEAHCVVTWGQSFRSEYLYLGEVRRGLGSPTCIALTASADPRLRDDLVRLLELEDPLVTVLPLRRDNIRLGVGAFPDRRAARSAFVDRLTTTSGKAVGYVPRRRDAVEIAEELTERGRPARAYHGQLARARREETAEFLRSDDEAIVVATNAFGMGIDIPDIALVAHLDLPPTLIDYYQEVGRAGRNGSPAKAVAFVGLRKRSRRGFAGGVHTTTVTDCARIHEAIEGGTSSRRGLAGELDLSVGRVTRAIDALAMAGAVHATRRLETTDRTITPEAMAEVCRLREEFDRAQQQAVVAYRGSDDCRWQQLLAALGEASTSCGRCDNCATRASESAVDQDHEGDELAGVDVVHSVFGRGTVVSADDGAALVSFVEAGPKTIDLDLCLAEGLVRIES